MTKSEKRKRTKLVAVRFTPDEHRILAATAKANNVSVGKWIRLALAKAHAEELMASFGGER